MDAERPVAPLILGLTAGSFILLGATMMSMFTFGTANMMGAMSGMMSNMYGGTGMGVMMDFAPVFSVIGFVSGVAVITGSVLLYNRPFENQVWGTMILIFSVISILGGMGGLLVGLVLGTMAGILGLTWKTFPATKSTELH